MCLLFAGLTLEEVRRSFRVTIRNSRLVVIYRLMDIIQLHEVKGLDIGLESHEICGLVATALKCSLAEVEAIWAMHRIDVSADDDFLKVKTFTQCLLLDPIIVIVFCRMKSKLSLMLMSWRLCLAGAWSMLVQ